MKKKLDTLNSTLICYSFLFLFALFMIACCFISDPLLKVKEFDKFVASNFTNVHETNIINTTFTHLPQTYKIAFNGDKIAHSIYPEFNNFTSWSLTRIEGSDLWFNAFVVPKNCIASNQGKILRIMNLLQDEQSNLIIDDEKIILHQGEIIDLTCLAGGKLNYNMISNRPYRFDFKTLYNLSVPSMIHEKIQMMWPNAPRLSVPIFMALITLFLFPEEPDFRGKFLCSSLTVFFAQSMAWIMFY